MRNYIVPPIPDSIWKNPLHFIAFGFGTGAMPVAPGTFGTLIAIPFYLALCTLPLLAYILVVSLIIVFSIWLCEKVSRDISSHDHQGMCVDEIVGYLVTMIGAPHGFLWIAAGFGLFRLFDIWKPWPINVVDQRVHGGFGMILDDVLAGVYSLLILKLMSWVIVSI